MARRWVRHGALIASSHAVVLTLTVLGCGADDPERVGDSGGGADSNPCPGLSEPACLDTEGCRAIYGWESASDRDGDRSDETKVFAFCEGTECVPSSLFTCMVDDLVPERCIWMGSAHASAPATNCDTVGWTRAVCGDGACAGLQ